MLSKKEAKLSMTVASYIVIPVVTIQSDYNSSKTNLFDVLSLSGSGDSFLVIEPPLRLNSGAVLAGSDSERLKEGHLPSKGVASDKERVGASAILCVDDL